MLSRSLRLLLLVAAPFVLFPLHAQSPAGNVPAAAADAYKKGLEAEHNEFYDIALTSYQSALKQAPASQFLMEAVMRVQIDMSDDKSALATTAKMISAAPDSAARAHAESLEAAIYYRQYTSYSAGGGAYEKDPKRAQDALRRSEAVLEHAVQDDPKNEPLLLLYAHVLAALHRDSDASREFTACAAVPGTSAAECARALRLSRDAELARSEPAPAFTATTLDGQPVSLDALSGKVILIDFWGSWCHFCVRDSGYVQSMLSTFDAKNFVLLEVDEGDSPETWTKYVNEHHLHGVQTQDTQRTLESLFRVNAFPTYLIVDSDGIIRKRFQGAVGDLRGEIRKLIPEGSATTATASGR